MSKPKRSLVAFIAPGAFAAALVGGTLIAAPSVANAGIAHVAVFFQSNVPIITVPDTTTPTGGVPGTTTSPVPVNPNPPPPNPPPTPPGAHSDKPKSMKRSASAGAPEGEDLYVYIVLQDRYKDGADFEKSMPGVIGTPWRPVTKMEKQGFKFNLTAVSAGSEYYVVGARKSKLTGALVYTSKHAVVVERQIGRKR